MKNTIAIITVAGLIILAYFLGLRSKKENAQELGTMSAMGTTNTAESAIPEDINPYDIYSVSGEDSSLSYYAINSNIFQSDLDSMYYADIETGETFMVDMLPLESQRKTIERNGYKFNLHLRRDQSKQCRGGGVGGGLGIRTGKRKTWFHAIISACKDGKHPLIEIAAGKGCRTPLIVDYPMYSREFPGRRGLLDCGIRGEQFRIVPRYKSSFHFGFVLSDCTYNLSQLAGLEFRIKYQGDHEEYSFKALDFYPNLTDIMLTRECPDRAWKSKSLETLKEENPRPGPSSGGAKTEKGPNYIEH